jgi:hypothetical protein
VHDQLFSNQDKNVPSCSNSFQRECKPIVNLLQTLISYYHTKDDKSNISKNKSSNKIATKDVQRPASRALVNSKTQLLIDVDLDAKYKGGNNLTQNYEIVTKQPCHNLISK